MVSSYESALLSLLDQIELGGQIIIWSTGGSVTDLYSVTAWHRVTWNLTFAIMWLKRFRFLFWNKSLSLSPSGWYLSMWNLKILWILRNQRLTTCKALPSLTWSLRTGLFCCDSSCRVNPWTGQFLFTSTWCGFFIRRRVDYFISACDAIQSESHFKEKSCSWRAQNNRKTYCLRRLWTTGCLVQRR